MAGQAAVGAHRSAPPGQRPGLALAAQCLRSCRAAGKALAQRQPGAPPAQDASALHLHMVVSGAL